MEKTLPKLSNAYVYPCEISWNDQVEIPTMLLFEIYDEWRGVLFHTDKGDVYIPPNTYSYATQEHLTYMFQSNTEYDIACFSTASMTELLTPWDKKLMSMFHISWFNLLRKFLNSDIFVSLLKDLAHLRKTQNVTPSNAEMFLPFLNPIEDTIIPDSITTAIGFEEEHRQLWIPFINYVNDRRTSNRKVQRIYR